MASSVATSTGGEQIIDQNHQILALGALSVTLVTDTCSSHQSSGIDDSLVIYPEAHLLGIPQEIRNRIFDAIRDTINDQPTTELSQHPTTGFEGLHQTCRQLYHETSILLATQIVPHNAIDRFLSKPMRTHNIWDNFKSLYVEIPHSSDPETFTRMAHALKQVADELRDLRIHGVGMDAHGIPTSSQTKACGKFDNSLVLGQGRLAVSGQSWKRRLVLVNAIHYLVNLKTLVLDNMNLPLLAGHVLRNKHFLESLYLNMDHRTTLHMGYRFDREVKHMIGHFLVPHADRAPLKELHISMNSTFRASQIVARVSKTLEKLTIIVPDLSRQSVSDMTCSFITDLAHILGMLSFMQKLHTLKLCIHGAIYENGPEFGELIGAFKLHMPLVPNLKIFELHVQVRSSWVAQEFFDALPNSLEKFFIPDILVTHNFRTMLKMLARKTGITMDYDATEQCAIGEDIFRTDFIKFGDSALSFLGYEFAVERSPMSHEIQNRDVSTLLKANAKLLDRLRNRHLAHENGQFIPLDRKTPLPEEEHAKAVVAARAVQLDAPMFDEIPEVHVFSTEDDYFGNEDAAQDIFLGEPVAKVTELPALTYPVAVDIAEEFRHSNHWICE